MDLKGKDTRELYFPSDKRDRYEYILQKAKKVLADGQLVVRFSSVRPPDTANPEDFPSTIVELELIGIPFEHPLTRLPVIPRERLEAFFERPEMQCAFISFICERVSATISDDLELQGLKRSLANVIEGRPSKLPPRLDLLLLYYELVGQIERARQKVSEIQRRRSTTDSSLVSDFLLWAPANFWWVPLLRTGKLALEAIMAGSPEAASKSILTEVFGVSEDTLHSRLFRQK